MSVCSKETGALNTKFFRTRDTASSSSSGSSTRIRSLTCTFAWKRPELMATLTSFLFEASFVVSMVNPADVRAFAGAGLSRTKTDKADAELIARFCLAQQPQAWQPPAPELRELQAWCDGSNSCWRCAWRKKTLFPQVSRPLRSITL